MTDRDDMACQELVEAITAYLEGELPPDDRTRFEAHLLVCTGCRQYLQQMRTTVGVLNRLRDEGASPEQQEQLLTLFRDWKSR